MTKQQLIYIVKTHLEGGDGGSGGSKRWHIGDILRYCEMAFSDVVEQLYRQAIQYHDWGHIDPLVKTYMNVPVVCCKDRQEYYVDLPVPVIQLPQNGGIRLVWGGKNQASFYYLINNNAEVIYDEIEKYDGYGISEKSFYVENTRLWIQEDVNAELVKINLKLIPALEGYDDDEQVPVVFGKEGVVFDAAMQRIRGIYPSDDYNDNSSTKIARNE